MQCIAAILLSAFLLFSTSLEEMKVIQRITNEKANDTNLFAISLIDEFEDELCGKAVRCDRFNTSDD